MLTGLARWIRDRFRAILAELHLVDSASLDVLLYCRDDLAAGTGDEVNGEPNH